MRHLLAAALLAASPAAAHALQPTPPQTEGPYYPKAKPAEADSDLTRVGAGPAARGTPLQLTGKVLDTSGSPLALARVEIWQVDHQGIYLHPVDPGVAKRDKAFQGYGETKTASDGTFSFRTILPPAYEGRPRHIHVKVTPAGGATLTTQLYFKGDPLLARDGIVRRLGSALDRVTLDAKDGASGVKEAGITLVVPAPRG